MAAINIGGDCETDNAATHEKKEPTMKPVQRVLLNFIGFSRYQQGS